MFREIQSSISQIKKNYDNMITFQNVINNLNSELIYIKTLFFNNFFQRFPLVEENEIMMDEMCSICHENLLVGRKLKCNHKFHMFTYFFIIFLLIYLKRKCLFFWLKAQQNTTCPVCRAEIPNITFLKYQKRSLLYRIISIIASLTDLNIRFVSARMNQENGPVENENQNIPF